MRAFALALFAVGALLAQPARATPPTRSTTLALPDRPEHRINDYANALSVPERDQIESQLAGYMQDTTQQIVVAIFPSLDDGNIEDISIRLAEKWKIGSKKNNDGVIVTIFVQDHQMRIEVGYGLEAKLTDLTSNHIINDIMKPAFRAGHFADGISRAVAAIHDVIKEGGAANTESPATDDTQGVAATSTSGSNMPLIIGVIVVVVILIIIIAMGGGGTLFSIIWALLNIFFSGGGSTGGSGGFSGGGGGFSGGGGGSFGGGGSSGSW